MTKNLLVFKGTLDPIHNSHKDIVYEGQEKVGASKIIVAPRSNNTNKKGAVGIEHRVNMSRLAFDGDKSIDVTRFSLATNTKKMLMLLKQQNIDHQIFLLMGADAFFWLRSSWNLGELDGLCNLVVASRDDKIPQEKLLETADRLSFEHGIKIPIIKTTGVQTSSGFVRDNINDEKAMESVLPQKVYGYIKENGLYGIRR